MIYFQNKAEKALASELLNIKSKHNIDFVIVNAENATHGRGLSVLHRDQILALGVDCITLGNHT